MTELISISIAVISAVFGFAQAIYSRRQVALAKEEVSVSKMQFEESKRQQEIAEKEKEESKRQQEIAEKEKAESKQRQEIAEREKNTYKEKNELFLEQFGNYDNVFDDVQAATKKIEDIIELEQRYSNKVIMWNFGLDLEVVMPWLANVVIEKKIKNNAHFHYKGLIINPDYEKIVPLLGGHSNISKKCVEAQLERAETLKNQKLNNVSMELRSYSNLPHFHGFVINEKHLFVGFTEIEAGKLMGGKYPYIYILRNDRSQFSKHLFDMFLSWFNYTWETSQTKIKFEQ